MTTHTRQTSLYTLRVTTGAHADQVADAFLRASLLPNGVQDHGPLHVGFRTTDDAAATALATAALEAAGLTHVETTLTTGLGVHRRLVAVQDAQPATPPAMVNCIQIGHNYGPHPLTDVCMVPTPAPATEEERQAWLAAHPHFPAEQRHRIRRDGDWLACETCGPDAPGLYAPARVNRCECSILQGVTCRSCRGGL